MDLEMQINLAYHELTVVRNRLRAIKLELAGECDGPTAAVLRGEIERYLVREKSALTEIDRLKLVVQVRALAPVGKGA